MKLALSNIAIAEAEELQVYALMRTLGFTGLEIAPTKLLGASPYDNLAAARAAARRLTEEYGLCIPSMQSIWYGQSGNIFTASNADALLAYTEKAVELAAAVNCKSLVFGCPKNRNIPSGKTADDALLFFKSIAACAYNKGTAIALEANVLEYGTNFINTSAEAFAYAQRVPHLKVNYDVGTLIANGEELETLQSNINAVSHIHISEPSLAPIQAREVHISLARLLKLSGYSGFVSVEMKAVPYNELEKILNYIAEVFA